LGTFRSPFIYTLSFDVPSRRLSLLHANAAVSGHSWLDVSGSKRVLYTTGWSDPPAVSAYSIALPTPTTPHPTVELLQSVPSKYLSGYVCSNGKAVYSACGPQVDVFELDDAGSLKMQPAVQSFALVAEEDRHKGATQLDFGGLRHGGHVRPHATSMVDVLTLVKSCDLSPCGTKLYVADIGRNCVWLYHVDPSTGYLTESSKNAARRQPDGPRHAWPHPNGRIVYSLQEHSSVRWP
jgi:carboxy-cis,cis-muconate cyclase